MQESVRYIEPQGRRPSPTFVINWTHAGMDSGPFSTSSAILFGSLPSKMFSQSPRKGRLVPAKLQSGCAYSWRSRRMPPGGTHAKWRRILL